MVREPSINEVARELFSEWEPLRGVRPVRSVIVTSWRDLKTQTHGIEFKVALGVQELRRCALYGKGWAEAALDEHRVKPFREWLAGKMFESGAMRAITVRAAYTRVP